LELADILAPAQAEQPARLRVCGKGQKERIVLLSADAYAVLTAWLAERPVSSSEHVFLNARGRPLSVNGIEGLLRAYGQQAGCPVTPHQLRHTFARQITEAGMPITSLGKLLGHAQVSTTQLYTAGADPALAEAYQTAMAQITAQPLLPPPPPPAGPVLAPAGPAAPPPAPLDWTTWAPDWPAVLRQACQCYVEHCALRWPQSRQRVRARTMRWRLQHFWNWQLAQRRCQQLADVTLADLRAFQQAELTRGIAPHSINSVLATVVALFRYHADQGQPMDHSVFRLRPLPRPDSLPRHLTASESQRLEVFVRSRLTTSEPLLALENACCLVLAHTGIRACECLELQACDLDLPGRRLRVRQGKGQRDRMVYLSDLVCQALRHYLQLVPANATAPLLRKADGTALSYQWLHRHLAALAEAAGVPHVSPHRLRHTLATRLLNAGMPITGVQKLLGHEYLSTTQIYARVYDSTLEADYRRAMAQVERQHLPLSDTPLPVDNWPTAQSSVPTVASSASHV
jgi:site-specific recombinase XerD